MKHTDRAQITASGYLERGGKAVIAILTLAVAMSGFQSCGQVQQPLPPNNGPPCFFFFFLVTRCITNILSASRVPVRERKASDHQADISLRSSTLCIKHKQQHIYAQNKSVYIRKAKLKPFFSTFMKICKGLLKCFIHKV